MLGFVYVLSQAIHSPGKKKGLFSLAVLQPSCLIGYSILVTWVGLISITASTSYNMPLFTYLSDRHHITPAHHTTQLGLLWLYYPDLLDSARIHGHNVPGRIPEHYLPHVLVRRQARVHDNVLLSRTRRVDLSRDTSSRFTAVARVEGNQLSCQGEVCWAYFPLC